MLSQKMLMCKKGSSLKRWSSHEGGLVAGSGELYGAAVQPWAVVWPLGEGTGAASFSHLYLFLSKVGLGRPRSDQMSWKIEGYNNATVSVLWAQTRYVVLISFK